MGHLLGRAGLGRTLWLEAVGRLKLERIVGFSQERKVLFTGRNKNTKALFINKQYMENYNSNWSIHYIEPLIKNFIQMMNKDTQCFNQ